MRPCGEIIIPDPFVCLEDLGDCRQLSSQLGDRSRGRHGHEPDRLRQVKIALRQYMKEAKRKRRKVVPDGLRIWDPWQGGPGLACSYLSGGLSVREAWAMVGYLGILLNWCSAVPCGLGVS